MKFLTRFKALRALWWCSRLLELSLRQLKTADTLEKAQYSLRHIQMLADWGYFYALEAQGILYSDETKPWYDSRKAVESWEKAAELDGGESMYDLALFYYNGRKDIEPDPITGMYWMERAAAAGQENAKAYLQFLQRQE